MDIDPSTLDSKTVYGHLIRFITPRPIAWVTTVNNRGQVNLAPFSFFTGVVSNPPTLLFCGGNRSPGVPKDTVRNAIETGAFVVNLVPERLADPMNASSAPLPYGESELTAAGLTAVPGIRVPVPRVAESPAQAECTVHQVVPIRPDPVDGRESEPTMHIVIGRIEWMHVDDDCLDGAGKMDPERLDALGRMGGLEYCRTRDRFEMGRP